MKKPPLIAALGVCLVTILPVGNLCAATVSISTSDNQLAPGVDNQGWVSASIANPDSGNDNYITGRDDT